MAVNQDFAYNTPKQPTTQVQNAAYPKQAMPPPTQQGYQWPAGGGEAHVPPSYPSGYSSPFNHQQQYGGGYTAAPPMNAGYPMPATVVMSPRLSFCRYPQTADCQSCRARVTTAVDYETSGLTWLICLGIFFIGFGCGCCFIPFFVNDFKKAVHRCPNCNFVMGQKDVF